MPYSRLSLHHQHGFTLIELVLTIVILAILAIVGLPRFTDLGSSARRAVVNQASGATTVAAETAHAKCMVTPGCYSTSTPTGVRIAIGPGGQTGTMYYGYPTGQSRVPSYFGIKDWLNIDGSLTLVELTTTTTEIRLKSAPDPTRCKVRYHEAATFGGSPSITTDTNGC